MVLRLWLILSIFLLSFSWGFELNNTQWLLHNKKVKIRFQKNGENYQAIAIEVAADFEDANVGDTIIRNIQYSPIEKTLKDGIINLGSIKACFNARLANELLLEVSIKKFFISINNTWIRILD